MRLQKYIAMCGYASRRKAEELITFLKANPNKIEEILSNNTVVKTYLDWVWRNVQ